MRRMCIIPKNKLVLYISIGMFIILYTGVFLYWKQKYSL